MLIAYAVGWMVSLVASVAIENTIEDLHAQIFLEHPFQNATATKILDEIFNNELIRSILQKHSPEMGCKFSDPLFCISAVSRDTADRVKKALDYIAF